MIIFDMNGHQMAWRRHTEHMPKESEDQLVAQPVGQTMTIGDLSKRTGVPVKQLRHYEDLGFIYTVGRSAGNYRLFDESAEWCVRIVTMWRALGLTLAEIGELTEQYLSRPEENIGPRVAGYLQAVRDRTHTRIHELQDLLERLDTFESEYRAQLSGQADFRSTDPRFGGPCA
jgi:MerR family transcriptional regulator, copper efflux regulator